MSHDSFWLMLLVILNAACLVRKSEFETNQIEINLTLTPFERSARESVNCSLPPKNLSLEMLSRAELKVVEIAYAKSKQHLQKIFPGVSSDESKKWILNAIIPLLITCKSFKTVGFTKYESPAELERLWSLSKSPIALSTELVTGILANRGLELLQAASRRPSGLPLALRFASFERLQAVAVLAEINRLMSTKDPGQIRAAEHEMYIQYSLSESQISAVQSQREDFKLLEIVTISSAEKHSMQGYQQSAQAAQDGKNGKPAKVANDIQSDGGNETLLALPRGNTFRDGLLELVNRSHQLVGDSGDSIKGAQALDAVEAVSRMCVHLHVFKDGNGRSCRIWSAWMFALNSKEGATQWYSNHWSDAAFLLTEQEAIALSRSGILAMKELALNLQEPN